MEYPNNPRKKKVPTIDTGTAITGISVDRKSCKKIKTTIKTRINTSIMVTTTLLIEASRNSLVSKLTRTDNPSGKSCSISPRRACRSEEHTSELQSRGHLVCRLLLEKKKH